MRRLALCALALAAAGSGTAVAQPAGAGSVPALVQGLFDDEIPAGTDVLKLVTGDTLQGAILIDSLPFQTPYGHFDFPLERVAALVRAVREEGDDPTDLRRFDHLVGVNGDEFYGLALVGEFPIRLASGMEITVPQELVRGAVITGREGVLEALPSNQHFVLRGGDHFSGQLLHEGPVEVRAPYGTIQLALEEVQTISLPTADQHGRVTMLTGTDTAGDVSIGSMGVTLDLMAGTESPALTLAPERTEVIFAQAGATPDPALLEGIRRTRVVSLIEDAVEIETDGTPIAEQITTETDTYYFRAREGRTYVLETANIVNLDTYIRLVGTDGERSLMENDDGGNGLASRLTWTCPESGVYYLQVWRLGMGPNQVQPGVYYGYTAGNYEARVTEQ